jgi:hypothetical protein
MLASDSKLNCSIEMNIRRMKKKGDTLNSPSEVRVTGKQQQ